MASIRTAKRNPITGAKSRIPFLFSDVLEKGVRSGQIPNKTKSSRKWFRNVADQMNMSPKTLISTGVGKRVAVPGSMYLYQYDPKHKKTLPYYDRFPLVFPIGPAKGGFLGLNMHYLPMNLRARLMDALYLHVTDQTFNDRTKIAITYDILQSAAKYKHFKPCLKHYLKKHVRSTYIKIHPAEWDIVLTLPLARWSKATPSKIYRDSQRIANKK